MKETAMSNRLVKSYQDYYKDGASEWRQIGAVDKVDNIISLCSTYSHKSILEVGAGEGSILKGLSELDFCKELYALEISLSGVEMIEKKGIPGLVECAQFDGYHIPYDDNRFDLVILSHVIEHVEHPRKLLYEAGRVARYVFVEVPLEDTLRLSPEFIFNEVGHINFYSPKTIRRLVQTCSLRVINQKVTNPSKAAYTYHKTQRKRKGLTHFLMKEYMLKCFPLIAVSIFSYHCALICQKNEAN